MDPDDIDNMDFELPAHMLNGASQQGSSSSQRQQSSPPGGVDPAVLEAAKSWTTVYPVYIDPNGKSHRKIARNLCPPNPAAIYMAECVRLLALPTALETEKRHPGDPLVFGRLKVQLKHTTTKKPLNPRVPTKLALLREIARMYPEAEQRLKSQDSRIAAMAAASRSEISKVVEELAKEGTKEASGSGSGGGKKKGKRK